MFTWCSDLEALKELCRQELDTELFKIDNNGDQSTSLTAKSVTFTPYKPTKSFKSKDQMLYPLKPSSGRYFSNLSLHAQLPQTFQAESQISRHELYLALTGQEENSIIPDNDDHEWLIDSHLIMKELSSMKQDGLLCKI